MKCKKLLALVMAAVLSVSMLTACGGGGGVKDTLSTTQVESLVEAAGSDAVISHNSTMNNIVRAAAQDLANGSSQSTVRNTITNKMGWGIVSQVQNFISQFLGSLGILTPNVSTGLVQIVQADQLEASLSSGGVASKLGAYKDKVAEMRPINTAEKFMATLVLASDGTLVQRPYSGLQAMRTDETYSRAGFDLAGTEPLAPVSGRKYELCGEFVVGSGDFGFNLFKHGDKQVRLYYSYLENKLTVDASGIDRWVNDGGVYDGVYGSTLPRSIAKGEVMKLHVFVDHSIMDVFVNDTWAFSMRLFPTDAEADGVEAFADGTIRVNKLEAWNLDENRDGASSVATVETGGKFDVSGEDGSIAYVNTYENAVLNVFDLGGRMVAAHRLGIGTGKVAAHGKGAYIVKLVTPANSLSKKIIVK